ncbi:MAG TPA: cell division protein ZapD [Gammaproteobacteria bacterium]|nr:cell division protein ZapD [Gammaproteobacteria bacterium]
MATIVYEQPLNERIRTFLRLEFLFRQADHSLHGASPWDSRATVACLIDILNIFGRNDLKNEIIKELERQAANLAPLERLPGVDKDKLGQTLGNMEALTDRLYVAQGQVGQLLKDNEFLCSIKQRSSIPGGTCDFDLPAYHHWLQQPPQRRLKDLHRWLEEFSTIREALTLILRQVRESAPPQSVVAPGGFYQQSLDTNAPFQLVRAILPAEAPWFAEISGGKHRFTIRFMEPRMTERPVQTDQDVEFQLACCAL